MSRSLMVVFLAAMAATANQGAQSRPRNKQEGQAQLALAQKKEADIRAAIKQNDIQIFKNGGAWLDDLFGMGIKAVAATNNDDLAAQKKKWEEAKSAYQAGDTGRALSSAIDVTKWVAKTVKTITTAPTSERELRSRLRNLGQVGIDDSALLSVYVKSDDYDAKLKQDLGNIVREENRLEQLIPSLPDAGKTPDVPPNTPPVPPPAPKAPDPTIPHNAVANNWPTQHEDLRLLADELCYSNEGDRCFDGRNPNDLKAFLDTHPVYKGWHSNASDATFAAPPSAVVKQQDEKNLSDLTTPSVIPPDCKTYSDSIAQTESSIQGDKATLAAYAKSWSGQDIANWNGMIARHIEWLGKMQKALAECVANHSARAR